MWINPFAAACDSVSSQNVQQLHWVVTHLEHECIGLRAAIARSRAAWSDAAEVQHFTDKSTTGLRLLCGGTSPPGHANVCLAARVARKDVSARTQLATADIRDRRAETGISPAGRHTARNAGITCAIPEDAIGILGDEDLV